MVSQQTKAALRRELEDYSASGAGLAQLIDHLHTSNRSLPRRQRLSDEQLDELSLACWRMQTRKTSGQGQLFGKARELWGGARVGTSTGRFRSRPRSRRSNGASREAEPGSHSGQRR